MTQEQTLRETREFINGAVDNGWDREDGLYILARIDAALAAPAPAAEPKDERAAFETWMTIEHPGVECRVRNPLGNYTASSVDAAWDAWQARAALAATPQPAEPAAKAVPAIVDGGWVLVERYAKWASPAECSAMQHRPTGDHTNAGLGMPAAPAATVQSNPNKSPQAVHDTGDVGTTEEYTGQEPSDS